MSIRSLWALRRPWSRWLSPVLFLLLLLAFLMPFASTSCTLPGGYGRGAVGTSTVYTGLDLALDRVPTVTPADRPPRPGSRPDDGQLGAQPPMTLALLVALTGFGVSVALRRWRAEVLAVLAALAAAALVIGQIAVVGLISQRIGATLVEPLPAGKTANDYVATGNGFRLALLLAMILLVLNVTSAVRARAGQGGAKAEAAVVS